MITDATPITTPKSVRMERILFAQSDCNAILTASPNFMGRVQLHHTWIGIAGFRPSWGGQVEPVLNGPGFTACRNTHKRVTFCAQRVDRGHRNGRRQAAGSDVQLHENGAADTGRSADSTGPGRRRITAAAINGAFSAMDSERGRLSIGPERLLPF